MPRVLSTSEMIECLERLLGTKTFDAREEGFVNNLADYRASDTVTRLSEKQVEWLADLHERFCT
jgi:hypothetical protein